MEWDLEQRGAEAAAIALAVLFGALLVLVYVWNRSPRRGSARPSDTDLTDMHASMLRLNAELPELFHGMNSRLDAKMQALRNLMREASATIEALQDAFNPVSGAPMTVQHPPASEPASTAAARPLAASQNAAIQKTADRAEAAELEDPVADLSPSDTAELRLQRYAHVYSLANSGLDPAEIASETGMHRGEVELVLNLWRKRIRVDRGSRSEPSPVVHAPEEATA